MDKIFEYYLKELVTRRTEELAWAAEKMPEFKAEMEQLKDLRDELAALVGEEKADELITAARGADVPIYEYCYRAGLEDGMQYTLLRVKRSRVLAVSCPARGRSYSAKSKPCPAETISCPAGALPFSNEFCILALSEHPAFRD